MYDFSEDELHVTPDMVDRACADPVGVGAGHINKLLHKLDTDLTAIRAQIDIAARKFRDHGIKSDENWFRSAQKALRIKEVQKDRLGRALMDARLGENIQRSVAVSTPPETYDIRIAFYNAAREVLHEEDFEEIMQVAQANIAKRETAAFASV